MGRARRRTSRPETPERRCIASRESLPKAAMVRFAVSPDGLMTPDIEEKLPGRGCWVKSDRQSLDAAERRNLFSRSVRSPVRTPRNLAGLVEEGLLARITRLLALARKSGNAVAGFEKAREKILAGRVRLLLQASDGSERQRAKLDRCLSVPETHICLKGCELGVAFGRDAVIHVAVQRGRLAAGMSRELCRLACLRGRPHPGRELILETAMS